MTSKNIDATLVGNALFEGVNSGKITMKEYKIAIEGWKIIKKVL